MSHTFVLGFLTATVVTSIPLLFPALGEVMAERSGVLNLALEGSMLAGALGAFLTAWGTHHLWLGVAAGAGAGIAVSLVMAFLCITLLANQVVAGTVLNILILGATDFVYAQVAGTALNPPHVSLLPGLNLPGLSRIPDAGQVLFQHPLLVYIGVLMVPLSGWFLYHTRAGLSLRATGEDPRVVANAGLSVVRIRYLAVLYSGFMAGIGGAYLALGQVGFFTSDLTAGRGFVAIAIVVFGRWNPYKILGATLF
ncbi:MAG: ABC transporter permease, partial [Chloroflexi bacterium]|nr:ABC transporter permease [Chloroflexota bacterium]